MELQEILEKEKELKGKNNIDPTFPFIDDFDHYLIGLPSKDFHTYWTYKKQNTPQTIGLDTSPVTSEEDLIEKSCFPTYLD